MKNARLRLFALTGEVRAALDAAKKLPEELRNGSHSPSTIV
jgi:hypothetical protein